MVSVLFVCMGNICRSPMAEAVFRHLVNQEGLAEQIQIDSAGTYDEHVGKPAHPGTRKQLVKYDISDQGLIAREVKASDLDNFTYVFGMDRQNVANLERLSLANHHIEMFVDLIPQTNYQEVPDPYFTGDFTETYQLVSEGCKHLLERIKREHSLS